MPSITTIMQMVVATLATSCAADGINCHGSSACAAFQKNDGSGATYTNPNVVVRLVNFIKTVDDNRMYENGQHIACLPGLYNINDGGEVNGAICAFLQSTTNGMRGNDLKVIAQDLQDHGCRGCGSVPTGYPETNDVNGGMLTFNFVNDNTGNCDGVC
ncbi:hypothetical protein LTR10_011051 [Elasticomyces elasticus]|uniref:Killer toxin Kp4 domain-containing protein n=1 Tax=Elasticomyces elasticus TaxID=574655 RepID=A0AAN7W7G2_9PEZI|nr:hypothetical protein LTR27_009442 [Elasticomyces elasticus]KAK4951058.1 hypothetical protein LTR10_011051 [Elasticomyces elasticus]KAK4968654.1 hypothetical protein LTR42_009937 [Elasticomyces elasticus]KAK5695769.1 hypothetical protein LTR97_008189 [Elasticomyces elasticus]KAK5719086.1 hypothetical protein LTR15_007609 [Elasticomyces elasticus]